MNALEQNKEKINGILETFDKRYDLINKILCKYKNMC